MYYIYILKRTENNKIYIGYTGNLERRLKQHQRKRISKLVYYEAFKSKELAMQREKKLKYYGSAWRALKRRISA